LGIDSFFLFPCLLCFHDQHLILKILSERNEASFSQRTSGLLLGTRENRFLNAFAFLSERVMMLPFAAAAITFAAVFFWFFCPSLLLRDAYVRSSICLPVTSYDTPFTTPDFL
jgi:hypothetical protein